MIAVRPMWVTCVPWGQNQAHVAISLLAGGTGCLYGLGELSSHTPAK